MSESKNTMSRAQFLKVSGAGLLSIVASAAMPVSARGNETVDMKATLPDGSWKKPYLPDTVHYLSKFTHELAETGLSGKWGRELAQVDWNCSDVNNPELPLYERYALATISVATHQPLRYIPGERLAGAATLLQSSRAVVPCIEQKVKGVTHVTIGFDKVLKQGFSGLRKEIEERISRGGLSADQLGYLNAMLKTIEGAGILNDRYIEHLESLEGTLGEEEGKICSSLVEAMKNVPENPPRNYLEAVQSLWFMFVFSRMMGNWSGIGRIDKILGPYLEKDLKNKSLTLDEAREILAHFWAKGTEWTNGFSRKKDGSGDAQYYQNVVIGGIDKDGNEVTNEVSYLVLDIVEELHISDFPVAVRLGDKTPEKLIRRACEVQRQGGGIIAFYNENTVIKGMVRFNYPLSEAREFTNDGCWETLIPGKTAFNYKPWDMVPVLEDALELKTGKEIEGCETFDAFYEKFEKAFAKRINYINKYHDGKWNNENHPALIASMFTEGCIENARDYNVKGAKYTVLAIHMGGLFDVANSLYVVKKLVYDEKYIALNDFARILRDNWKGQEGLRNIIRNRIVMCGNDNEEADRMLVKVFDTYTGLVWAVRSRNGILRPCGFSTFGREIEWAKKRSALPEGSKEGDMLACNCSPTPGTDRKGPTAVINSYCKLDLVKCSNGATIEMKLLPESVKGRNGLEAMVGLAKTFKKKGGYYMHVDVVDTTVLVDAQRHPEKYPNLPIRVSGWSARFTTLGKEWQDMLINRTQQIL